MSAAGEILRQLYMEGRGDEGLCTGRKWRGQVHFDDIDVQRMVFRFEGGIVDAEIEAVDVTPVFALCKVEVGTPVEQ
jgi:hypothetical protein